MWRARRRCRKGKQSRLPRSCLRAYHLGTRRHERGCKYWVLGRKARRNWPPTINRLTFGELTSLTSLTALHYYRHHYCRNAATRSLYNNIDPRRTAYTPTSSANHVPCGDSDGGYIGLRSRLWRCALR
ncbi:hypothetical protein P280DRAFT_152145 [Massarina eburnea CBS 473.64]|uniref:Uncharacterized protein n=1 Tax=Massarina eburnea CBS 473.64 TaxID=1395130 RepID=A0A6A6RM67_9PLEO|nr:hypothetical protein P280DRAFT_152145 [Massarina eburnea CBS 473.64]